MSMRYYLDDANNVSDVSENKELKQAAEDLVKCIETYAAFENCVRLFGNCSPQFMQVGESVLKTYEVKLAAYKELKELNEVKAK